MNEVRNEPTLHAMRPIDAGVESIEGPGAAPPEAPSYETAAGQSRSSHRRNSRHLRRIRRLRILAIAFITVCAIAALISVVWQPRTVSQLPVAVQRPQVPEVPAASKPRYPIEPTATALPSLDASDGAIVNALRGLWSGAGIGPLLESRDVVRNIVVTVDNLPRRTLPAQKSPLRPPPGSFGTASAGNGLVIGDANALRYAGYVRLLETVDPKQLVDGYVRHYALFQQAYRELGYPEGHFNDRLVDAIDVVLATPDVKTALAVVQPRIFYEFADRELEQLPAGQKLLLRMGRENAAIVKTRLREIRRLIANEELDLVQIAPQR